MKRIFDILSSLIALTILLPFLAAIIVIVKVFLGSPVFFTQKRPGQHGKPFKLIKFRTMKSLFDADGNLLPDDKRLTKFGSFLRASSLDELPELFNVIKGDMSLVGPRPLLMEYLPLYSARQMRRHEVKPGITGWAQINGRNSLTWEEKFDLDVWYVDNQSFWLDLKILFLTIAKVFKSEGISQEGHVTMEKFTGSPNE